APIPTQRQLLAAASDGKLVYAVGGNDTKSDLATVEAYDPAAKTWTAVADLAQPRSDLSVAITDGRLVAVGGMSAGQVLKSVAVLDLMTRTWAGLPDMETARHGMAVDAVEKAVYAIGGSTGAGDRRHHRHRATNRPAPRWRRCPGRRWRRFRSAGARSAPGPAR
ncbi:hypothetical protein B1T47_16890, partial [Mycobacterium kansasii]